MRGIGRLFRPARERPDGAGRLAAYRERYAGVEGWFSDDSQAVWDFLFTLQTDWGILGDFVEIGVWKGKSAFLGALHMRDDESVVLVDIGSTSDVLDEIRGFHGDVASYTGRSTGFRRSELYAKHRGRVRFFHVDGDHTAFATYADLSLASEMICANGVIAIDDFGNMRYPQLHAGVYQFLFQRPDFKMFLCGAGKAYLCLAEDLAWFDQQVRERLLDHVTKHGSSVSLHRSSYAHDYGCFSVQPRVDDRAFVGRDEAPDEIVF